MADAVPEPNLVALIPAAALEALPALPRAVARLAGGRGVNQCYRVDTDDGRAFVVRLRRGPALAGADAHREVASQRIAAAANLAPCILAADADAGWTVMEFVAAAPWSIERLREPDSLARLGRRLSALHSLAPPEFPPADGVAFLRAHCAILAPFAPDDSSRLQQEGERLAGLLEALPPPRRALCHGDPDVGNFLGDAPTLIDFEYAQVADPTYDLALLLSYYPDLETRQDLLLRAAGLDDAISRRRLPLQTALCRLVNVAWKQTERALSALD